MLLWFLLSLFTPSFRRSTASSGRTIKYLRYVHHRKYLRYVHHHRPNCPIADTNLCLQRNTVYQLTCKACGEYYIGSTTRFLHDRTKEHLTNDNSSVKKHLTTHHRNNSHNIEVKVITRENDPVNLRLYEAYYIRKHKPGLNSREECTELNDLLF